MSTNVVKGLPGAGWQVLVGSLWSVFWMLGLLVRLPVRRILALGVLLIGAAMVGGLIAEGEWGPLVVGIVVTMLLMGGWDEMRRSRQTAEPSEPVAGDTEAAPDPLFTCQVTVRSAAVDH